MRLFGQQGYEATSIQAIADSVGVRKQSLLHHFPSKEALHEAVIDATLQHWRDEFPRLLAHASGADRFSAMVTAVVRFFRDDPNRARLALREMLDRPDAIRAQLKEQLSPYTRLLADYIRMGQQSGIIRSDVQPEAYLVQALLKIISTVATGDVAAALVGQDREAHDDELVRGLRESLFITTE